MTFPPPSLDDLSAADLVALAQARLAERGSPWRGTDPADPGLALIEAFATITAQEIDRLNALPEVLQARFLSLLGAELRPRMAEATMLRFERASPGKRETTIPGGLRVAASEAPETVFTLLEDVTIPKGGSVAEGLAARVERVRLHKVGYGTGAPAQQVQLPHGDLVGAPAAAARIDVLVDWTGHPLPPGVDPESHAGSACIRFHEVARLAPDETAAVFAVDRVAGRLRFPLAGPCIPPPGAEISAGYCHGASLHPSAPVAEATLSEPLTPLPGITVTNTRAVATGRQAETAGERLERGPVSMLTGDLAFRARDYEALALEAHPGVARAHALTPAARWAFAVPGTVRVLIAPHCPPDETGAVTAEALAHARSGGSDDPDELINSVRDRLMDAAPLGVCVEVDWLPVQSVAVDLRAYVATGTDRARVARELRAVLGAFLSPLPGPEWPDGWVLGRSLRKSQVIERLLAIPDVRGVDKVCLRPRDPMEGAVTAIAPDCQQDGVWFAAMGGQLYRTLDHGAGWTRAPLPDAMADIVTVATHPVVSGLVAAVDSAGVIAVSRNCGQRFEPFGAGAAGTLQSLWVDGGDSPRLLMGGEGDMAENVGLLPDGTPGRINALVATDGIGIGPVHALAAHPDGRGGRLVGVARMRLGGVLMSNDSGWDGTFRPLGLEGRDVRALGFLQDGEAIRLVAGCAAPAVRGQTPILMARIDPDTGLLADDWRSAAEGWPGGTVRALAPLGPTRMLAVTATRGLVHGEMTEGRLRWRLPEADAGLPLSLDGRGLAGLHVVAVRHAADGGTDVMVGGEGALLRSDDHAEHFDEVAQRAGTERLSIPADWTICPDTHTIEVSDVND